MTLNKIVEQMCETIAYRASRGDNFGVALVPEGLIEFIPAIGRLIDELNDLLAAHGDEYKNLEDKSSASTSCRICRKKMQKHLRLCPKRWLGNCRLTATRMATYRFH